MTMTHFWYAMTFDAVVLLCVGISGLQFILAGLIIAPKMLPKNKHLFRIFLDLMLPISAFYYKTNPLTRAGGWICFSLILVLILSAIVPMPSMMYSLFREKWYVFYWYLMVYGTTMHVALHYIYKVLTSSAEEDEHCTFLGI